MVSAYQGYIACQDIFSSGGPFSVADGMDLLQNPRDLSYDSLLEIARDSRFFCTVSTSTTMGSAKPCGPQIGLLIPQPVPTVQPILVPPKTRSFPYHPMNEVRTIFLSIDYVA